MDESALLYVALGIMVFQIAMPFVAAAVAAMEVDQRIAKKMPKWTKTRPGKGYIWGGLMLIATFLTKTATWWTLPEDIASLISTVGPWIFVILAFLITLWAQWPSIHKRIWPDSAFDIRPMCGDTLIVSKDIPVLAQLAIKNTGSTKLCDCSVRLMGAYPISYGSLHLSESTFPSRNPLRGETFLLRWSSLETEAKQQQKYLDIAPDGAERILDLLILDREDQAGRARFAAANPEDLTNKLQVIGGKRWWKLIVRISSSSDKPNTKNVELVAGVSDRDPGPITLDLWHPRGEEILRNEKEKWKEKRA